MANGPVFSHLVEEYGNAESSDDEGEETQPGRVLKKGGEADAVDQAETKVKGTVALMQEEERNMGAINSSIYGSYLKAAGGLVWGPAIILLLTLAQGASGMATSR